MQDDNRRKANKSRAPRRAAIAIMLAALAAWMPAAAQSGPQNAAQSEALAAKDGTVTRFQGWEVRYGVAGGESALAGLAGQAGKAESYAIELFKSKDPATGDALALGVGEAHGLFAVPLEAAAATVVDYPNLKAISPRVREVRILDSSAFRWKVYEDIGISFMGISIGYKLDAETFRDELPDGAIGIRCRLAKSHDGKLYTSDSSWYFRKVEIGGATYTYIRTWSTSGLRNPGPGVAGIMKLFTAGELRDQVAAVAKVAAKR
ncbi:hypothetical protein LWX53_07125 [bacterium]|nr:hypothetical protein [bacterium]